jgi:hypothetical protein
MFGKVVATAAATVLMVVLVAGLIILRFYGAEGPCGSNAAGREIGNAMKIGECR